MTHGTKTAQDDRKADAPDTQGGFDLSLLWLWPVLLLQIILETFAHHTTRLKALRKADPRYSEPDWLRHVENLRLTEWEVRAYLSGHALKLLSGQAIDPSDGLVPLAPPGWTRPEPRSARELILRFEAIARIYANPMRHIERYARRLAKARPGCAPAPGVHPATTIFRAAGGTMTIFSCGAREATTTILSIRPDDDESHPGVCIRGPPRPGCRQENESPFQLAASPARARAHA